MSISRLDMLMKVDNWYCHLKEGFWIMCVFVAYVCIWMAKIGIGCICHLKEVF